MSTLAEIEQAAEVLPVEQKQRLAIAAASRHPEVYDRAMGGRG
jgi:hypothetical protein